MGKYQSMVSLRVAVDCLDYVGYEYLLSSLSLIVNIHVQISVTFMHFCVCACLFEISFVTVAAVQEFCLKVDMPFCLYVCKSNGLQYLILYKTLN